MQTIVPDSHGEGMGSTGSRTRAVSPSSDTRVAHRATSRSRAAPATGRRLYVVDWTGVSTEAIAAMDEYLDALLCR